MPVTSRDTWDIQNTITVINADVSEALTAAQGTVQDLTATALAATTATIPSLNGGTPMITGGGAASVGSSSSIPTIQVAANGAVTLGSANVSDNFTSNLNSTSDTVAASANALNQVYQMVLSANGGGGANVIDSVVNTSIVLAAAANSVKFAYDTAIAANSYAASIAATAFTNAAARADAAYTNAITFSGNAAAAFTNAALRADAAYTNAVAFATTIAGTSFANAALRADAAYTNAIAYSGNAALAFANAVLRADAAYTNAVAFATTIAGTAFANAVLRADAAYANAIVFSANATNLGNGTVPEARLTQASASTNGIMRVIDSVTNTSITIAASANSVKQAYDAAVAASSGGVLSFNSRTGAVTFANTDAEALSFAWTAVHSHAANINPTSSAHYLGQPSARWNLYGNGIEVTTATLGTVNVTSTSELRGQSSFFANVIVHPATTTAYVHMRGISNSTVNYQKFLTFGGGAAGTGLRWTIGTSSALETGSNAGSFLVFNRYDDSAVYVDQTAVSRATGVWAFANSTTHAAGGPLPLSNTQALGSSTARWVINANTINMSGILTSTSNATFTSAADTLVTITGGTGYGGLYLRGANTTTYPYLFMGNATSGERFRMSVTDTKDMFMSFDNGVTLNYIMDATQFYPSGNASTLGLSIRRWTVYANTVNATGAVTFGNAVWNTSQEGSNRIHFATSSATYFGTPTSYIFRGSDNTDAITLISNSSVRSIIAASNTGASLGSTTARWVTYANTINATGVITQTISDNTYATAFIITNSNTGVQAQAKIQLTAGANVGYLFQTGATLYNWACAGGQIVIAPNNGATNSLTSYANGTIGLANATFYTTIPSALQANTLGLAFVIPEAQNGAYTILLDDFNQMKRFVTGAAASWTIANNSTTAYPLGFNFVARNMQANTLTVARGTGVTLRKAGATTNTDVTIAQWGYVSFVQEDTNVWVAAGTY